MNIMENSSSGIKFTSVLVLIFITLKLTGNITWSWWWVFSPWWIGIALSFILFLFALGVNALGDGYGKPKRKRNDWKKMVKEWDCDE